MILRMLRDGNKLVNYPLVMRVGLLLVAKKTYLCACK